jgi:hypothetical protein
MRSCPQCTNAPPPSFFLDLSADSPATRSALYSRVADLVFEPEDDDDTGEPIASADAAQRAGLVIMFLFNRYFAAWALPADEAAGLPPCRCFEMVRIELDPEAPAGLLLSEV